MNLSETKSGVKAIYLQAASLSGFEVGPDSPMRLAEIVDRDFGKVNENNRTTAVATILRIVAASLESGQQGGVKQLREIDVEHGEKSVCPVYPFGGGQAKVRSAAASGHKKKHAKVKRRKHGRSG